ncbi:PTS sugar transporter subunit IIA [Treponema endosymbiont of Eucomonympha sp.]|uniref:PTS sugar transporter subunit IIA n=1 Tax=Treponema endosymbiont of Eucomonympha sp. TaxID=1580831 RepID=UPI000A53C149|nr:PTS sugar transporter subunit IIA [Treponema endosymbiont of Eucomonympha sp.]
MVAALVRDLKREGFYVQTMNSDEGLSYARKGDISFTITEKRADESLSLRRTRASRKGGREPLVRADESLSLGRTRASRRGRRELPAPARVTIETSEGYSGLAKMFVYEIVLRLNDAVSALRKESDALALKAEILDGGTRGDPELLKFLSPSTVCLDVQGDTKKTVLKELVALLANSVAVRNEQQVLDDVFAREKTMSTGMQRGIALPHARSDGVSAPVIAVGIRKAGVDFDSLDGEKSKLFVLIVSPRHAEAPHLELLAACGSMLHRKAVSEEILSAETGEQVLEIIRRSSKK